MKIFIKTGVAWDKINFVDEDNRVIGWDAEQICCEAHSARLTAKMPTLKVNPQGSIVDDPDDMSEEELKRHLNLETVYRATKWVEVTNVTMTLNRLENATLDLPSYRIDPEFFKRIGEAVVFRLVGQSRCGDTDELFVVLENHHNGYYSHGFSLSVGGEQKFKGFL